MSSGSALDMEGDELCLIDARVTSLADLTLRPHLSSLNLHCNLITKMENLLHLRNLCHMDLSSNQISKMECLDGLISLKTLNLACNRLEEVKGIGNLRSVIFNLSPDLVLCKAIMGKYVHPLHLAGI